MGVRVAVMVFIVWSVAVRANGGDAILAWQAPFDTYLQAISRSPDNVKRVLMQQSEILSADPVKASQYDITLSHAYYMLAHPEPALSHARQALQRINAAHQPWLFHQARLAEAAAFDLQGTPGEGLKGANAALAWADIQNNASLRVSALFVRGVLRTSLHDTRGAMQDLQLAYQLVTDQHLTLNKGIIAGTIALVYEYLGEDALAIPFFEEAVAHNRKLRDWAEVSIALFGLGRANRNVGFVDLGRQQLLESAQLARDIKDQQGIAYALNELGLLETDNSDLTKAKNYLAEALTIFRQADNRFMSIDVLLSLARLAIEQRQFDTARGYLDDARTLLLPQGMVRQAIAVDEVEAAYLAANQQFESAYLTLEDASKRRLSLQHEDNSEQLHIIRAQYELDASQREVAELEQENQSKRADLQTTQLRNLQLLLLFTALLVICGLLVLLVHKTKANKARLEVLANTDGLTGLANRRYTLEKLHRHIDLAERHGHPLAVAIVDLDHFKKINDKFGHPAGDKVLREFGQLCQATFRHTDIVGRIGGEEFLIALPHTSVNDAQKAIKSLSLKVKALSGKFSYDGLNLSISSGLTQYRQGADASILMQEADKALYDAKQNGRDRLETFTFVPDA